MAVRAIVLYPDPGLLTPTRPVEQVTDEIRELVQDMVETMYAAPGIGLAANQVGVPLRVCIVDLTAGEEPDRLRVLINPQVRSTSEEHEIGEEGCLSFPDITLDIERPARVTVEALDLQGQTVTHTEDGLMARAMQHEIEHLEGRVFLQNVSPLKRELVKRKIKKRMQAGDWVATAVR